MDNKNFLRFPPSHRLIPFTLYRGRGRYFKQIYVNTHEWVPANIQRNQAGYKRQGGNFVSRFILIKLAEVPAVKDHYTH